MKLLMESRLDAWRPHRAESAFRQSWSCRSMIEFHSHGDIFSSCLVSPFRRNDGRFRSRSVCLTRYPTRAQSRLWKDGKQWKSTESFGRDDLPLLCKVAD